MDGETSGESWRNNKVICIVSKYLFRRHLLIIKGKRVSVVEKLGRHHLNRATEVNTVSNETDPHHSYTMGN